MVRIRVVLAIVIAVLLAGSLLLPTPPSAEASNRWIDIDLSRQTATAMEGSTPVYTALVSTGKPGFETPTGTFRILRRVYNETMDSATTGIPRNAPEGYLVRNVYFTQYFTWYGHALHYNWWSPSWVFGRQPNSHGCVGMRWQDAQFFWNFATIGTPVVIHY